MPDTGTGVEENGSSSPRTVLLAVITALAGVIAIGSARRKPRADGW